MNLQIVIPVYNEESHLQETINSIVSQSLLPNKVVFVDDNSTDNSLQILKIDAEKYDFIEVISIQSKSENIPGAKVIHAFYKGFQQIDATAELIGKFDADIILPKHYFETLVEMFHHNPKLGIAGGNLYIQKDNEWVFEAISSKKKVRGPIKLYRKGCFQEIGGLKPSIGWDTVDELLAQYHGWEVQTNPQLMVKHLKPTGSTYSKKARYKQGEAFKKMRYGFWLTFIASGKLAWRKKSFSFFINCLKGYFKTKEEYLVSKEEGKFIRKLRWRNIKKKLF